eukprot:3623777-Prymnesium_polylepis.1
MRLRLRPHAPSRRSNIRHAPSRPAARNARCPTIAPQSPGGRSHHACRARRRRSDRLLDCVRHALHL